MTTALRKIPALQSDGDYRRLKRIIIEATGLAYYEHRDEAFEHGVRTRLDSLGITDLGEYLERICSDAAKNAEFDLLVEQLTIGETHFFRHQEVFEALRLVVLPTILQQHDRPIRVWTAGCSNGAETHSLAIQIMQVCEVSRDVFILGTDINQRALQQARRGVYSEWDLRGTDERTRRLCFTREGKDWLVRPEFHRALEFQYHNLVLHPFPSVVNNVFGFDLIFCRNVLMYFSVETVRHIIAQLYRCLVDGGWLVVGHAEPNVDLFASFQTVNVPGAILYRKESGAASFDHDVGVSPERTQQTTAAYHPVHEIPRIGTNRVLIARPVARHVHEVESVGKSDDRLEQMRSLADRGNLAQAERFCREWLAEDPLHPVPHFFLGLFAEYSADNRSALEQYKKALYLNPRMLIAHYHLGLLQQKLGDLKKSGLAYRNALQCLEEDDHALVPYSDGFTVLDYRTLLNVRIAETE